MRESGGGFLPEREKVLILHFFFLRSKEGGNKDPDSVRKNSIAAQALFVLMSFLPSTRGAGGQSLEGGRDSQATLNLTIRDLRRRNRQCSSLRPLRHLCASHSDPVSTREESHDEEDPASRMKEPNNRRRALLLSGAGLVLSAAASASTSSSPPPPPPPPPPPRPSSSSSASLDSIRSAYDLYSSDYDSLDGGALADLLGFTRLRRRAVGLARGRVLELAVGTGLSLPLYYTEGASSSSAAAASAAAAAAASASASASPLPLPPAAVTSLTAVDLSPGMLSVASRRIEALGLGAAAAAAAGGGSGSSSSPAPRLPPPVLVAPDGAALPFADSSFDTVLDAFSLCVFPDPLRALREARRVLEKERGRLVVVEHARALPSSKSGALLSLYQDATAGLIASSRGGGKGCVWNQDVPRMLAEAGFEIEEEERAAGGTVGLFVCRVRQ